MKYLLLLIFAASTAFSQSEYLTQGNAALTLQAGSYSAPNNRIYHAMVAASDRRVDIRIEASWSSDYGSFNDGNRPLFTEDIQNWNVSAGTLGLLVHYLPLSQEVDRGHFSLITGAGIGVGNLEGSIHPLQHNTATNTWAEANIGISHLGTLTPFLDVVPTLAFTYATTIGSTAHPHFAGDYLSYLSISCPVLMTPFGWNTVGIVPEASLNSEAMVFGLSVVL